MDVESCHGSSWTENSSTFLSEAFKDTGQGLCQRLSLCDMGSPSEEKGDHPMRMGNLLISAVMIWTEQGGRIPGPLPYPLLSNRVNRGGDCGQSRPLTRRTSEKWTELSLSIGITKNMTTCSGISVSQTFLLVLINNNSPLPCCPSIPHFSV